MLYFNLILHDLILYDEKYCLVLLFNHEMRPSSSNLDKYLLVKSCILATRESIGTEFVESIGKEFVRNMRSTAVPAT